MIKATRICKFGGNFEDKKTVTEKRIEIEAEKKKIISQVATQKKVFI